jgi:hypothetical protein
MDKHLKPYERAGRVIKLMAWVQLVIFVVFFAGGLLPGILKYAEYGAGKADTLIVVSALIFLASVFQLEVGQAVKDHKRWGRMAGIIYGIFLLFFSPVGTLLGGCILWRLLMGWKKKPVHEVAPDDA